MSASPRTGSQGREGTNKGIVDADRLSRRRDKIFSKESIELDAAAKVEVD